MTFTNGFYPLYDTENVSNSVGNGSSHSHILNGIIYYMPNGVTGYYGDYNEVVNDENDTSGDTTGDTSGDTTGDTSGDTTGDTSGDTTETQLVIHLEIQLVTQPVIHLEIQL